MNQHQHLHVTHAKRKEAHHSSTTPRRPGHVRGQARPVRAPDRQLRVVRRRTRALSAPRASTCIQNREQLIKTHPRRPARLEQGMPTPKHRRCRRVRLHDILVVDRDHSAYVWRVLHEVDDIYAPPGVCIRRARGWKRYAPRVRFITFPPGSLMSVRHSTPSYPPVASTVGLALRTGVPVPDEGGAVTQVNARMADWCKFK